MKKLSAKKLKIIAVAVIILIIASAAALAVKSHSSKSDNQTLSREATVTRGNIVQGLSETGSASVNTVSTQLDIDLEIDDAKLDLDVVIDDVYVRAGERVTKGQPLFSIDQNSLNTARNTLENEYTSAKLKLEQAKIQQQKGTIEAKSTMDTDKSSGKLAEQIYQNSITSIDNTLASYKQKVLEDEEDLTTYQTLYNTYDERTTILNSLKSIMEQAEDTRDSIQDAYDEYKEDNDTTYNTYKNYKSKIEDWAEELNDASANLDYINSKFNSMDPSSEEYKDYAKTITTANDSYTSTANQLNTAVEYMNKYRDIYNTYTSFEDRLKAAKNAYTDAQEIYNDYNDEYKELFGSDDKSDILRKLQNMEITLSKDKLTLEEYEMNYDVNVQAAANEKSKNQTTGDTAELNYSSSLNELELSVLTAQNKVDTLAAAVNKLNSSLDGNVLLAPTDGLVTNISFEAGDEVSLLEAFITIAESDEVNIVLTFDEDDIADVYLDQLALVSFDSLPDKTFEGKVNAISITAFRAGAATTTYQVTVNVASEGLEDIYDGMSCSVELITDRVQDVLCVSKRAITTENGVSTVTVKNADGSTEVREITTDFTDGSTVEVLSGLSEGETVLIESQVNNTKSSDNTAKGDNSNGNTPSAMPAGGEMPSMPQGNMQ